ncbi:MAG TPA: ATP synthase F1 subunit delta [candidate division Zixibacteria bacterium]|nr:ATP synthase F1 subunit delta [candidate division Zixibacteria bacterium]
MMSREVAKKYANALYLAGKEKNIITEIYEQLTYLGQIAHSEKAFLEFLKSPRNTEKDKKSFVSAVLQKRVHAIIVQFLYILLEKHRIKYLREIIDEFDRLVEAERGIGRATVISATPLTESEKRELTNKLSSKLNLKIKLETEIDPSLMGGAIIFTHDQIIDGSVKHGLDLLEQSLNKVRVA